MLSPEIFNFPAPESLFQIEKFEGEVPLSSKNINNFYYNHLITVIIPDSENLQQLDEKVTQDCSYYKILGLKLEDLVDLNFICGFTRSGKLSLLSIDRRIDCDTCFGLDPYGQLHLTVDKETYQSLGLEGRVSHFTRKLKNRFSKLTVSNLHWRKKLTHHHEWKMPTHRAVPSLQSISLKSIGSLVVYMAPAIISKIRVYKEQQKIITSLKQSLDWLNKLLSSHVPFYLYDEMAVEVLKAVKTLIEKTKKTYFPHTSMASFLTEMNVVVSLTEVVLNCHLKSIDFSQWPKIMRYVLHKNLHCLTGLENLNLGSCSGGWRTAEYDRCILESICKMKNLRSLCLCFDCSDIVVQTIGDHCPNIQCLDLTSSRSVTDRSIPHLLKCQNLRELQLHRTSVTTDGLAQLIIGLPKLQDIGRCDEFGNVIKLLHQKYSNAGPFVLKKIQTRDVSTENLRLFVDMFPKIEYVSLFHDMQISDLTVLISLNNLRDLKLLSCAFYGDYLKQLLEIRGCNITSLHLEHVEEMDFKVLVDISQCCPKLKSLVFYNCDFRNSSLQIPKLKVQPFLNLERIFWVVDSAINHLEFILNHALNIRYIHLGSSTGITHSSIVNILTVNPMRHLEEIRVLYSSDMSMRTVELLLASCINLKVLSELESWQGINIEELKTFKEYIYSNNFDLDIRPTLSFTT